MFPLPGVVTLRLIVTAAVAIPVPAPCNVSRYEPAATLAPTATVTVDVVAVVLGGLKVTVTPAGAPELVRFTVPVKVVRAIVSVVVADAPCCTLNAAGLAVNTIVAVTLTTSPAVWLATPVPVPCTDNG